LDCESPVQVKTSNVQRFLEFSDQQTVENLRAFYAPLFPRVPRPSVGGGMQKLQTLFASRYPAAVDIVDTSIIHNR